MAVEAMAEAKEMATQVRLSIICTTIRPFLEEMGRRRVGRIDFEFRRTLAWCQHSRRELLLMAVEAMAEAKEMATQVRLSIICTTTRPLLEEMVRRRVEIIDFGARSTSLCIAQHA